MTLQAESKSPDNKSENLLEKIDLITKYQKPYIANSLRRIAKKAACNVKIICEYVIAEQNAINIKESTKEGKIKCLVRFSTYLDHKPFDTVSRQDVLDYLTSLKKPESTDPQHKSIGTYNGRQMILLKFFRWLYNPNESDASKRKTPHCMSGIRRLPRMEKSAYKPSDLWSEEEHEIFLKYCPSARDKAFHSMAFDTSARPSELLALRIGDIFFRKAHDGTQYGEIVVTGKTKSRTLPLISSLPYLKQYLQVHPQGTNPGAWLFISYSKQNNLGRITRDGLLKKYVQYYKKRFFPSLLEADSVSERDKAYIRNMLLKPFSLYVFRHMALTHKSSFLKEHILRDRAGWSLTSKMPQVYIHYFGTESSNSILEAYGIAKNQSMRTNILKPIQCPNCLESNDRRARFCISCKMILRYDVYTETLEEQKKKESEIGLLKQCELDNADAIATLSDRLAKVTEDLEFLKQKQQVI
jgi:integrase